MFKLNDEVATKAGYTARVICVDAPYNHNGIKRPIVAIVKVPATILAAGYTCVFCDEKGVSSVPAYNLNSNEPTEDEAKLIAEVRCLVTDPNSRDADERMLKVIRKLRSK